MPGKEFEIARKLMQDRKLDPAPEARTRMAPEPATFREIDGRELARQYVAHRKLAEAETRGLPVPALENSTGSETETPGVPAPLPAPLPAPPAGLHRRMLAWVFGLWRS